MSMKSKSNAILTEMEQDAEAEEDDEEEDQQKKKILIVVINI